MSKGFLILGLIFIAYYIGILLYAGIHASFAWFWCGLGAVCLLASAVLGKPSWQAALMRLPAFVCWGTAGVLLLGFLLFLAAQCCIVSSMTARPSAEGADYLIVLGAQVKGTKVSRALKQRLDTAASYLQEHGETVVIVSGGQGAEEDISEARAMAAYLLEAGIAQERIFLEDRSVNTVQNIRFSRELMQDPNASTAIVSNDFHVFRAVHIAKAQGLSAEGVPAPTELFMRPHYMVREAFALVKDLLRGNAVF